MKIRARDRVKAGRRFMTLPLALILLVGLGAIGFLFGIRERDVPRPPVSWKNFLQIEKKTDAVLSFADEHSMRLIAEHRAIPLRDDPAEMAVELIGALLVGPRNGGRPTLPPGTRLRALYMAADNTAVVDFSQDLAGNHPGGVNAEILTIFSIVNTLTRNVPQIKRVKLLVEGAEIETLSGHVDCLRPFSLAPAWLEDGQS